MWSHEENSSAGGQHLSTCFAKQQYLNLRENKQKQFAGKFLVKIIEGNNTSDQ